MGGEEQSGLAGRVSGSDDVHVEPMGTRRVAAGRPVRDALADEALEAVDVQVPPRDAAREDDRPRLQHVSFVQVDAPRGGVDPLDRARDEDLGSEPPGLLERPACQLVARDA